MNTLPELRAACEAAGRSMPSVAVFAGSAAAEGALPQGLRCLGGRVLANAAVLRQCLAQGLSCETIRPLAGRIVRDLGAADAWRSDAGLVEY